MATIKTIYVDPDAAGSGTGVSWANAYTSIAAALSTESGASPNVVTGADLVTNDEIAKFLCRSSSGSADTVAAAISITSVWTTDLTRYIWIVADTSDYATGAWDASRYRINYTATGVLFSLFRDALIEGIQQDLTHATSSQQGVAYRGGGANYREVKNCYFRKSGGGIGNTGIYWGSSLDGYISNCVIDGFNTGIENARTTNSWYSYNNTLLNCGTGLINSSTATAVAKNNLFSGCTTDASGTFAAGTDYNASNNASIGYTVTGSGNVNDRVSQTFTFDSGAILASSDAGARDYGTDLSADASYSVTTDITGTTRGATWDIGAFEYVAAASGPTTHQNLPLLGVG